MYFFRRVRRAHQLHQPNGAHGAPYGVREPMFDPLRLR